MEKLAKQKLRFFMDSSLQGAIQIPEKHTHQEMLKRSMIQNKEYRKVLNLIADGHCGSETGKMLAGTVLRQYESTPIQLRRGTTL